MNRESKPDFLPCKQCGMLILANKQRCPCCNVVDPLSRGIVEPKSLSEMTPKEKVKAGIRACNSEPDERRLLTGEERDIISDKWEQAIRGDVSSKLGNTYVKTLLKAQLAKDMEWEAKTASIKDTEFKELCANCDSALMKEGQIVELREKIEAECQERVKRIFEVLKEECPKVLDKFLLMGYTHK